MSKYLSGPTALIALAMLAQPTALSQEDALDDHANHDQHEDHDEHEDHSDHDHDMVDEDGGHDEHEDGDHENHESDGHDHDHSKTLETIVVQATRSGRLDLSRFDSGPDRRLSTIKETGLWDKDTVKTSSERRFG